MDQVCQQHSDELEVYVGRVRASFEQIPIAALVTVVNAAFMSVLLLRTEPAWGVYTWFGIAVTASAARMMLWWLHRHAVPTRAQYRLWSLANGLGTLGAGLVWGLGSILLLPEAEIDQLFWVFLIGGMCAGAASLHYPHLPTAVAFMIPAGLPLAIRFALDGSARLATAAVMIVAFLIALVVTSRRANRFFGETLRLRIEMTRRTRELDAANAKLREEIAERHAAEASLRHAYQMEAVGQLTGAIAHDFNNLLTAVLGSLALLRKCLQADDRRAERFLQTAIQGAEKGAALTQRLLAFGRRQTLMPEVLDVAALLHGMSALLDTSVGVNVRVSMRFPRHLPRVEVDANQLELAVMNLAVNARDAMPGGGEIKISAREAAASGYDQDDLPAGRYVVLSVADTGQGMDKATLNRATEPFFTTKAVGKGTGLGLSMVHGFAGQSGGRLVLRSEQGSGTVVELWLPEAETVAAPVEPQPALPRHPGSYRGSVLVVDDDPLVLESTVAMLDDLGYAVEEATAGQEALAHIRDGATFDLIITDYLMPGMTGLQLVEELHRVRPRLAVLLTTGYAELQLTQSTPVARLTKPFNQEALARAVERCLEATSAPLQSAE